MDNSVLEEMVRLFWERARKGDGPSLIEAKTVRFRMHSEGSPDVYHFQPRPEELVKAAIEKDPVPTFAKKLVEQGILTESDLEKIDKELDQEVAEIDKQAMESPPTDPAVLAQDLYAA